MNWGAIHEEKLEFPGLLDQVGVILKAGLKAGLKSKSHEGLFFSSATK